MSENVSCFRHEKIIGQKNFAYRLLRAGIPGAGSGLRWPRGLARLRDASGVLQGVRWREAGATGFSVAEREVHREEYLKLKILTTNLPEL
ncbi:MAG: hypothetical protein KAS59_06570 [Alphaproteobacteria bacterium]|nr:hypothetical protein [Alphaproteobacteria bacterium]